MCLSPISIPNPYLGCKDRYHDTKSKLLAIPCGVCAQCVRLRQAYWVQRTQIEQMQSYLFFVTLTYNNNYLPSIVVNNKVLNYVDTNDWTACFDRVRKNVPFDLKYVMVTEYGGKKHRPHIHAILAVPRIKHNSLADEQFYIRNVEKKLYDSFFLYWSRNIGTRKNPVYDPLFTYAYNVRSGHRNFDCHYIDPSLSEKGESDVAFYISKYVLKYDGWVTRLQRALHLNLDPEDYVKVWKLLRPKRMVSKGFGKPRSAVALDHLQKCIDFSIRDTRPFLQFINPQSGQTFPMAPYIQRRLPWWFTKPFHERQFAMSIDDECTILPPDDTSVDEKDKIIAKYKKVVRQLNDKNYDVYDIDFDAVPQSLPFDTFDEHKVYFDPSVFSDELASFDI